MKLLHVMRIFVLLVIFSWVTEGLVGWVAVGVGTVIIGAKILGRNKHEPPTITCQPVVPYENVIQPGETRVDVTTYASTNRGSISPRPPKVASYEFGNHGEIFTATNDGLSDSCSCSFRVKLVTCEHPLHPYKGSISCPKSQVQWGDTCTSRCDTGYKIEGSATNTCGNDGKFSPRNFATCKKKVCPAPSVGENMSVNCRAGHAFESWCTYKCDPGYNFKEDSVVSIQCQADQTWSGGVPECIDVEPPIFDSCPSSMFLYPERLSEYAIATWEAPTATDPQDGPVPVNQITGPSPGSHIPVETPTTITYAAEDLQGNQAIPCVFEIIVRARTCPAYPFTHRLNVTCYNQLLWGSRCELECERGYPLHGPDTVYCEEDADQILFWDWGDAEPYCEVVPCHDLRAPRNGALSCSGWTHGRHCQMMCNILYDIPRTAPSSGEWVCDDTQGRWSPLHNPPDCSELRRPGDMNLPSDLFYFTGDCTSQETQDEIRENYIKHLNQSNYKALCIEYPECSVDNVEVICGPTDGKMRSQFGFTAQISFDFIIKLKYPQNFTSDDYSSFLRSVDDQFYAMADQFHEDVSNGILDLDVPGLDTQTDPDSFTYGYSELICEPGMEPRFETFSCASCPTGTRFNSEINDCELCPVGEYQDEDGQFVCKMCPDASSTLETGSTNITECLDLCDYGHYSDTGMVSCAPCPVGTYMDDIGALNCTECPDDKTTLSVGSNTQELCLYEWELGNLDVCNSSICNGGYCVKNGTNIVCICNGDYTGDFCELLPDPCRINDCQNGATCQAEGLDDYNCICPEGFDGEQCEDQIINGGPSNWGMWSECSVTCGQGEKTRERTCDHPRPGPGGAPCNENGRQTVPCNMGPCPECPDLTYPDRYIHNCTQFYEEIRCEVICEPGYLFTGDVDPRLSCGMTTNYEWSFGLLDQDANLPECTQSSIPEIIAIDISFHYPEISCQDADSVDITHLEMLVHGSSNCTQLDECDVNVKSGCYQSKPYALTLKRNTQSLALIVEMSGHVDNTDYFVDGHFDNATAIAAVQEYNTLLLELDAILVALFNASENGDLDVMLDGQVVSPSREVDSRISCPPGKVDTYGLCGNCPVGTQEYDRVCDLCPLGFYQDREGQTYCIRCENGYTTQQLGSKTIDDCVLEKNDEVQPPTGSGSSTLIIILCAGGAVIGIVVVAVFLMARNRIQRKNKVDADTFAEQDNAPSHNEAMRHENVHELPTIAT